MIFFTLPIRACIMTTVLTFHNCIDHSGWKATDNQLSKRSQHAVTLRKAYKYKIYTHTCTWLYVCIHVAESLQLFVSLSWPSPKALSMCGWVVCMCMCMRVYVRVTKGRLKACIFLHVCMYMHLCVCVCAHRQ